MRHACVSTALFATLFALTPGLAFAHAGHAPDADFFAGLFHPLTGPDHLLAMVAIGIVAARHADRRALWPPVGFVAGMTLGALVGFSTSASLLAEIAVAASVIVLGFAVMSDRVLAIVPAALAAAAFGIAHGYVHGVELGAPGAGRAALAGILLATGLLHALGLFAGRALRKNPGLALARRGVGGAMAAFGATLLLWAA